MFRLVLIVVIGLIGQALAQNEHSISEMHAMRSQPAGQPSEQRTNNNPPPQVILLQKPQLKCGHNEVVNECVTPCQPTCEFPNQQPCPQFSARNSPQPSILVVKVPNHKPHHPCQAGCVCAQGFVRNEFGMCIPKHDCPPLCKPHSHFEKCGPRCQPTCEMAEPRGLTVCTHDKDVCVSGCFCDAGYVKDLKTGYCVRPKDCSQICPENEHYSDYGHACAPTCQKPIVEWHKCHNYTKELPGCYCDRGFLRDWETKKCIPAHLCPPHHKKECPPHEHWYECKPCTPLCHDTKPHCTHQCHPGCDCDKGLVRDRQSGKCMPLCECPEFAHIHLKH